MLQAVTGLVLLVNFSLGAVVGTRLLRMRSAAWWTPERMLGLFFVLSHVVGGVLVTGAYGVWTQLGQAESPAWISAIHAFAQTLMAIGHTLIYAFTWRTFYPESKAAKYFVMCMGGLAAITILGRLGHEGFAITLSPGPLHWTFFAVRLISLTWVSVSSIQYWSRIRKRVRLGLADPMVANRFLLWGLWAAGNCMAGLSEPIARFVYGMLAGDAASTAASLHDTAAPLLQATLSLTSTFCTFTTCMLWLAFFPTTGYRNWIVARSRAEGA